MYKTPSTLEKFVALNLRFENKTREFPVLLHGFLKFLLNILFYFLKLLFVDIINKKNFSIINDNLAIHFFF